MPLAARGQRWIASYLAMTGKRVVSPFSSLRAKRGNLCAPRPPSIAPYLAMEKTRAGRFVPRGNKDGGKGIQRIWALMLPKGAENSARQCSPASKGQASVQVPVVITSPAWRSTAPGHWRSSFKKWCKAFSGLSSTLVPVPCSTAWPFLKSVTRACASRACKACASAASC